MQKINLNICVIDKFQASVYSRFKTGSLMGQRIIRCTEHQKYKSLFKIPIILHFCKNHTTLRYNQLKGCFSYKTFFSNNKSILKTVSVNTAQNLRTYYVSHFLHFSTYKKCPMMTSGLKSSIGSDSRIKHLNSLMQRRTVFI